MILISDYILGGLLLLFSAFIFWETGDYPKLNDAYPGPALFPRVIAMLLFILAIIMIISQYRKNAAQDKKDKLILFKMGTEELLVVIVAGIMVVLYILAAEILTYYVMGFLLPFVVMKVLKVGTLKSLLVSAGLLGFTYVIFVLVLKVPLPTYIGF